MAPSTLCFTIQWIVLSKPRLLQMSFGGGEKKGKKEKEDLHRDGACEDRSLAS